MLQFEDMSNELILCVWDQLVAADVLYSFSNLNTRFDSLLVEFHGLYKQMDLRYCSLSACRFFCQQMANTNEWRLGLTILKLGNCYRCSQTDMFVEEMIKFLGTNHFVKTEKSYNNNPKDIFDVLMASNKYIEPIFPQLACLVVFQTIPISETFLNCLLFAAAGGSSLRRFIWSSCYNQTHHSRALFNWLFRCSASLVSYKLRAPPCEDGFELQYEYTLINNYTPHCSLISLTINILNLTTLYVLLHYLPQLEHLDVYISSMFSSNNVTDQKLTPKLNYPNNLRVFILRHFVIDGRDCSALQQLVEKFSNTLEEFSLYLTHYCKGEVDICFNGYHLTTLCNKLSRLRSLHFTIQIPFLEHPDSEILAHFIAAFRTPFWLDGPMGYIRVCVNYHRLMRFVQIYSLPYTFYDDTVFHTIDLIDVLFNDNEYGKQTQKDLPVTLETLWYGVRWLYISFNKNQKIPISFLYALQCSRSQGRMLVISQERGILPNNIEDHVQLTHFNILQLKNSLDINNIYDLTQLIGWLRLLPNIKCLYVNSNELQYWFTNDRKNKYLNTFLQHLDRLYIDCSPIINMNLNEEIMIPLLSFVINKNHFPKLQYLRFVLCKHNSSSWCNINKWIDFIFIHINEHQLECLRFDFIEKEQELMDIKNTDEIITMVKSSCIVDIQRFVSEDYVSFWIQRK
ncbi:unnamed protein product [Adineta steineri]|uniref:F-box domain-containing protein n=1 Tax=Adineta steineri TaxID=433720 RepID=A0A813TRV3_9BILA|nr:unnamed protein product [Adineta steineri]